MFLFAAVRRWYEAIEAIYSDMRKLEDDADYIGDDLRVLPRTTAVMYFALIPPLARYLARKLI